MKINFYNINNELVFWCDIGMSEKNKKMIEKGYIEVFNQDIQGYTRLYFKNYPRVDFI